MGDRPLLVHGELLVTAVRKGQGKSVFGNNVPTCLSHHPGPDPMRDPLGWRPLCGRRPPSSIKPDRDQVTCRACLSIMGQTIYEEPV